MDIKDYLPNYLEEEIKYSLLDNIDKPQLKGFIFNPNKLDKQTLLSDYPKLIRHPIYPYGFIFDKNDYELGKSLLQDLGGIYIMDPASMLPAYFLNPNKGDYVLDLCSAPGGKTAALSLLMEGQGVIISNDISYPRSKETSSNIERMGLGNVVVTCNDFSLIKDSYIEKFDRILVDAPCSMMAMFSKNSLTKQDITPKKIDRCAAIQSFLLDLAASFLKPGGTLVYSTCTFSYIEDEGVILNFLSKHNDFEIDPLPYQEGFYMGKDVKGSIYLFPGLFMGEGQYIARLKKKGEHLPTYFPNNKQEIDRPLIDQYGLGDRSNEIINNTYYSLSNHIDISKLNVLRYGVKLGEVIDNHINLDIHLGRYLSSTYSIALDNKKAHDYLLGMPIRLDKEDGYYLLSYKELNIGFTKVSKGIGKNHYPKGLRKDYKQLLTYDDA